MHDEKLKPCPFCRGKGIVIFVSGSYGVKCTECNGAILPVPYQSKEEAIAAWNRRSEK